MVLFPLFYVHVVVFHSRVNTKCILSIFFRLLIIFTGTTVNVPLNANKLIVTKLKIDNSRKRILDRLAAKKKSDKGKVSQQDVSMAQVD
jgi:hypothetical protein